MAVLQNPNVQSMTHKGCRGVFLGNFLNRFPSLQLVISFLTLRCMIWETAVQIIAEGICLQTAAKRRMVSLFKNDLPV